MWAEVSGPGDEYFPLLDLIYLRIYLSLLILKNDLLS